MHVCQGLRGNQVVQVREGPKERLEVRFLDVEIRGSFGDILDKSVVRLEVALGNCEREDGIPKGAGIS